MFAVTVITKVVNSAAESNSPVSYGTMICSTTTCSTARTPRTAERRKRSVPKNKDERCSQQIGHLQAAAGAEQPSEGEEIGLQSLS